MIPSKISNHNMDCKILNLSDRTLIDENDYFHEFSELVKILIMVRGRNSQKDQWSKVVIKNIKIVWLLNFEHFCRCKN